MKEKLIHLNKIQIQKSPFHGYGVFAIEDIEPNIILEEVPFLEIYDKRHLKEYVFKAKGYPSPILPAGFGWLYNSALKEGENNATYYHDRKNNIFVFKSIKKISKGEEILTFYGKNWWSKGRLKAIGTKPTINLNDKIIKVHKMKY